jgi:predicted amidohydrolase
MRDIKAAAVQFNHKPGDKQFNLERVTSFVEEAYRQKVELLVFPEMCITGYWHVRNLNKSEIEALAEPVPGGPSTERLVALAQDYKINIGAGLIEKSPDGNMYNTYVVAMSDGNTVLHRKLHCFISEHMASGSDYTVFDIPQGPRVAVLICYDNNIFENTRVVALRGTDILLAPHQTGGCKTRSPRCMGLIDPDLWRNRKRDSQAIEAEFRGMKGRGWLMRWLPSRAHDNGMFLVYSNGVGIDDNEVRTGNAMILDPYGEILVETGKADDDMVVADLEAIRLEECTGRRWIRSRRPELYGDLAVPTGDEQDTRATRF